MACLVSRPDCRRTPHGDPPVQNCLPLDEQLGGGGPNASASLLWGNNDYEIPVKGFCSLDFCSRILFHVILRENLQSRKSEGQAHGVFVLFLFFKFCFCHNFCLVTFREARLDLTALENRQPGLPFIPESDLESL